MPMLRAWSFLVAYSARRNLASRKVLVALGVLAALALVVGLVGFFEGWTFADFAQGIVLRPFALFYLPIVAVAFGCAAVGESREDGTLVYLLTRPIARWAFFLGKFLAVLPAAMALDIGGLLLLCRIAVLGGEPDIERIFLLFLPAVVLGGLAYLAFFALLGALFRHSVLIGIAVVFFIEVFMGRVPGILKRLSISFYTWSMFFDAGKAHAIEPPEFVFLPVDGETAALVLASLTVAFLALGALAFARKEYRDLT